LLENTNAPAEVSPPSQILTLNALLSTVRDDCDGMSQSDEPKTAAKGQSGSSEVLTSLPRHRPQRLTARRRATREATAAAPTPAKRKTASPKGGVAAPKANKKAPRTNVAASQEKRARPTTVPSKRAPKQGFAAEETPGRSVQAPNGSEMLVSALALGGTLGRDGLVRGGRLLKGALARVPRS
jgi:hypothetical protein